MPVSVSTLLLLLMMTNDSSQIGSTGQLDWGNSWWEDSYNSALNSGKKKKAKKSKNALQKMKKAGNDSDSDSGSSGTSTLETPSPVQ